MDLILVFVIITFFVGVAFISDRRGPASLSADIYVILWLGGFVITLFFAYLLKSFWVWGLNLDVVPVSDKREFPQVIHEGWNLFCSISTALMIAGIYSLFYLFPSSNKNASP